eukprot:scaffold8.g1505.t1
MAAAGGGSAQPGRLEPLLGHPRYEKIRDLDKGAFGWVQHARNKETGEEVAVKFIMLGPRRDFQRGGGGAAGCGAANLNIAHRDIKLGNIPILKVCDFGYSKNMIDSAPKTRVGTAAYISPEVARSPGNQPYDTEKADVWSCGVTLYCMLSGRYPFLSRDNTIKLETIQQLTAADVQAACAHLRGVSPECVSLLLRIFEIDPARRLSYAGVMADPWFRQFLPDLSKLTVAPPKEAQASAGFAGGPRRGGAGAAAGGAAARRRPALQPGAARSSRPSTEDEINRILLEAKRLSKLRQAQADDFDMEGMSAMLEEGTGDDVYAEMTPGDAAAHRERC